MLFLKHFVNWGQKLNDMKFERDKDVMTTLRIGRARKAAEVNYVYASVGVRPIPEDSVLTITMTITSLETGFISLIQKGDIEEIDKRILKIAWKELEHSVYDENNFDYLLDKKGKISAKFDIGAVKVYRDMPKDALLDPCVYVADLQGKDIIFNGNLHRYPEDL